MKSRLIINALLCSAILLIAPGCHKVLDKNDLTAVDPATVWNDPKLANAYVTNLYNDLMPGMPQGSSSITDEGVPNGNTDPLLLNTATIDTWDYWPYATIRKINILFANIDKGTLPDNDKNGLRGQAYFWRAWAYFGMVRNYGGVPLVLDVQSTDNLEALSMNRNLTSECITQIVKDLDAAIAVLPNNWPGEDGKITKGAAMAFKGRVLLFYASPMFNPTNDKTRWQAAYDANKGAIDYLRTQGKGLYADYSKIWDDELNKEVIMVRRYAFPAASYFQGGVRPINYSKDATGVDRPSLELVNAFPNKDGSPFNASAPQAYDTYFQGRDDRFYATVSYNGGAPYLADMFTANGGSGTRMWTYADQSGTRADGQLPSTSSFYRVKGLDKTIDRNTVYNSGTDWPEIRFAEVLMNYGEAANETAKYSEALGVLYEIRTRAGILPGGNGHYGITASTENDIRKAYLDERFVEFAFENKRFDDLRRLRKLTILADDVNKRRGLSIVLKPGQAAPTGMEDINVIYPRFNVSVITVDTDNITLGEGYYFHGIPKKYLDRDPKLKQTKGWDNGDFDPLK
jgi:starch-binding outer membrane protein, SusD/RagB family